VDSKTNEAKSALDLFKTLVLKGKVIVGDAMFCQREICEEIVDSDGDYFFTVKDNQPTLLKNIRLAFANTEGFSPLPTT
jgi:predicted transposase YbfD/YdcC